MSLTRPLRPSSGIHEIMRITFEVQNGIVQSRNSPIRTAPDRTWKARKYAMVKPSGRVMASVRTTNFTVDR